MVENSPKRLGGWLLLPLIWLLLIVVNSTLQMAVSFATLLSREVLTQLWIQPTDVKFKLGLSLLTAVLIWCYSIWVTILFFKRSRRLPRHYIIWLLLTVLLAIKTFAFAPVSDALAVQALLIALLPAALLVPYFKRSARVKETFTTR